MVSEEKRESNKKTKSLSIKQFARNSRAGIRQDKIFNKKVKEKN